MIPQYKIKYLLLALISVSLVSCVGEKTPDQIYEDVSPSIVLINYRDQPGHGTGFFVEGKQGFCTVLTAYHVLQSAREVNISLNNKVIASSSNIQHLGNTDLGIVTFSSNEKSCPYPRVKLGNSDEVKRGETIRIFGYPNREGESELILQFPSGEITNIESIPLPQGYAISYDVTAVRGMSGGAVVNSKGEVIAIHGKTDLDLITLTSNQGSNLSPEQQEKVTEINNRVESVAQINHFKWGIPINSFKDNFKDINLVTNSPSSPSPTVTSTPKITPNPITKPTVIAPIENQNPLITDQADFTRLNDLLNAGEWQEADLETWELMLLVTNRKKDGYLEVADYQNFPSKELRIMDQLWVKYSNGKFGFSVQKEIWVKNGGKLDGESDYNTYEKLAEEIGWKQGNDWLNSRQLTFNTNAPTGHLPSVVGWAVNYGKSEEKVIDRGGALVGSWYYFLISKL